MHTIQAKHFSELKENDNYLVESSDAIEDPRVYVKTEGPGKVLWFKERFLTDDEIVENVVDNATSRILWTIHRPKRGWYLKIRAPAFPPGVAIPLKPLPPSSPFHSDAALSFSTRVNPPKMGRLLSPTPASGSSSGAGPSSPPTNSNKSSMDSSSETVVHSYPPTPSVGSGAALGQPPSPDKVYAKLDQISTDHRSGRILLEVREFFLAPHSTPHVQAEKSSLITKALHALKYYKPSHSLSFTLCPLPLPSDPAPSSSARTSQLQASTSNDGHRHSLLHIEEYLPPSPPLLITFHDRSKAWSLGSFTGLLEIDTALERGFGVDRSFWVAVALAYMEFLVERESYLAAADGD